MKECNLIVGAGLSGAVMANLIANVLQEKVLIIDKRSSIAGNIFDYKDSQSGITVHKYGPHIFHTNNKKVWDYLSKYTKWHNFFLKPNVVIEGNSVTLPFNLTTIREVFPSKMADRFEEKLVAKFGYGVEVPILKLKEEADSDLNFLADYIYKNVFENYTLKQWGLKPEEINPAVTARVPVRISSDNRYFQDKYQGIPKNGYTTLVQNLLANPNIKVKLNTDFKQIKAKFDRIFYSGAIDEYFDYKYGELPYRSLKFDIQTINKEYYQKAVVTNYPNDYDFTRITEHKYFLDEKSDKTIISLEYPQAFKAGENERYYPIENEKNFELYQKYKSEADKTENLYFIGRLGEYKYYNMDLAVEKVFELFERIK